MTQINRHKKIIIIFDNPLPTEMAPHPRPPLTYARRAPAHMYARAPDLDFTREHVAAECFSDSFAS